MRDRSVRIEGNIAYVPLTQGYEAVIDVDDVESVRPHKWCAIVRNYSNGGIRTVYAARSVRGGDGVRVKIYMHRLIAKTPNNLETDHIDGNGLNNRRINLRPATRAQNQHNRKPCAANEKTGIKGVAWSKSHNKWKAKIDTLGKRTHLGYFNDIHSAAAAYAKASAELHGDFGRAK